MELACALVLLIVGSVSAGPYGYGTKGGATTKADARAVAGAYTGAAGIPLSIPSGAGYSGSFSQSSSSSSSSSSASSSSFSYSGAGAIGGTVLGSGGCSSENCNSGVASGSQGSAVSQAYSGANTGSLPGVYGGNITPGSYSHKHGNDEVQANKNQDCGSGSCQGINGSNISSGTGAESQSSSAAKAAASAEAGHTAGSNCGGSDCNNIASVGSAAKTAASAEAGHTAGSNCGGSDCNNIASVGDKCISGKCDSKEKCSSGDCGSSNIESFPSSFDDSNKCISGQCEQSRDTDGSSSTDGETNDINVHTIGSAHSKASGGVNKPGCYTGNCGSVPTPASPTVSSYSKPALDLTAPKLEPSLCFGSNCPTSPSDYSSSSSKAPSILSSYQNENHLSHVSSPNYGGVSESSYIHASLPSSPVKPAQGANCAPGIPGCGVTVAISSPSAPGYNNPSAPSYERPSSGIPSYSFGSTPIMNPSSLGCAPGTPGCISFLSPGVSSDCTSGNCGTHPSEAKPNYGQVSFLSISAINHSRSACSPGSPGCSTNPTTNRPDCALGNCETYPSDHSSYSGIKPSYSQGSLSSYSSINPTGLACTPGSPGCPTSTSSNGLAGCASGNCGGSPTSTDYSNFGNKPSYSHGALASNYPSKPLGVSCAPGTPGCGLAPSTTGSSNCASGKCNINPIAEGYDSSPNIKPSHSYESSPSHIPLKPVGSPCAPGNPDCSVAPSASGPSDCVSGNCGSIPSVPGYGGYSSTKPYNSQGVPSFSTLIPTPTACASGSPGCGQNPSSGISGCTSGNCGTYLTSADSGSLGIKPDSYGSLSVHGQVKPAGPACVPGTPGCALPLAPKGPSGCKSGNCNEFPPIGGQGSFPNIKPSYTQESSSYFPVKPSGSGCVPGVPGCDTTYPSPQGCSPGSSGCSDTPFSVHPSASEFSTGHPTASTSFVQFSDVSSSPNGQTSTGILVPGYGASSAGSISHNAAYGTHGTGSLQTSFNKPSTGPPIGISGNGAYTPVIPSIPPASTYVPGSESSPPLGTAGTTAGASGQHDAKENLPVYNGGFGGPAGILKPNEYSAAPAPSYGNKPTLSTDATTAKPGIPVPGYGASSAGSISHNAAYGTHGAGSLQTSFIKPSTGPPIGISGNGAYTPGIPSIPSASTYVPGSGSSPPLGIVGTTAGASGQHDAKENLPVYNGGFGGPAGILKPNEYSAAPAPSYGNKPTLSTDATTAKPGIPVPGYDESSAGSISHNAAYGTHGTASLQTSFIKPSTGLPIGISGNGAYTPGIPSIPSASTYVPGSGSSPPLGIVSTTVGVSGQHDVKENLPVYNDGFGGPAGILKPNEHSAAPAPSYGNKPTLSTDATNAKPNCVSGTCDTQPSHAHTHSGTTLGALATAGASASADTVAAGASGQHDAKENLPVYNGGFGGPAGILKPNEHSAAPAPSYGNKPTLSTDATNAKPNCVSGTCDTQQSHAHTHSGTTLGALATAGASASADEVAAGTSGQHDAKGNLPVYNGGFGGPAGILKPDEHSAAPVPSYGNKPTLSTDATNAKPNCVSGTCDTQPSHAHIHSGTTLGALATAGASASADAVAYTGGFGGPPGLLKPYDNGKTEIKSVSGLATSLNLNQGLGGSGYSIGGSHVGGSAIAQANTVSSAGASSGDSKSYSGGYSHGYEHGSTGGCGGGCSGTGSGNLGYSSTLGLSKTEIFNDSSSALAASGAIAKSVANAFSGARAFSGSYASSSATAHAGASVKGGYGRR